MSFDRIDGAHVVVTGGAGFLGSHLCTRLVEVGARVTCLDNLITGRAANVEHLVGRDGFRLVKYDVTDYLHVPGTVEAILHFASPASPVDYREYPIQTLKVGAMGTHKALGMARAHGATFLLASTSEVYGDPEVHPQAETYAGNVDPVGPRGMYDEAKRFAEALTRAYHRSHGVDVRIARIFNTYGQRMRIDDGRAVPSFVGQALRGEDLTVHGDGAQTRSLCYVDDLVDGIVRLLVSGYTAPVNLGSEQEVTVLQLAELVRDLADADVAIRHVGRSAGDPSVRRPDLAVARAELGWEPTTPLAEGLRRTLDWFRGRTGASEGSR